MAENKKEIEKVYGYEQGNLCPECKQFIGTNTMCSDCARFRSMNKQKENEIRFIKNNMIDLIPIAKKLKEEEEKENEIEKEIENLIEYACDCESSYPANKKTIKHLIDNILQSKEKEVLEMIDELNEVDFKGEIQGKVLLISKEELKKRIEGK